VKQWRMNRFVRNENDFAASLYRETCPTCGAEPFAWCRGVVSGERLWKPHVARRGRIVEVLPVQLGRER